MVKLIRITAVLLAAVFGANAYAGYYPETTVLQASGANLHANIDNFPASQATSSTQLPAALGQTTMAGSLSCAIASDQSAVPVSGTFWQATQPVSVASLPLPTGGSTAANQTTANTTLSAISGQLPAALDGSGFLKVHEQGTVAAASSGTAQANAPVYNDYTSTSVTTSAYVQMVASTSNAVNHVQVFDSSGQALYLATGAAASEVNQLIIPPGGGEFPISIASGTRISLKAVTGTASSGYITLNFYK